MHSIYIYIRYTYIYCELIVTAVVNFFFIFRTAETTKESIGCYRADMMALFNGEYVPHDVELVFRGDDTSVATEESGTAQSQRSIPAHRLILSARCPRLSRILLQDAQITKINVGT